MVSERPDEAQVHQALQVIVDNREVKALDWAVNYALYGTTMVGEELRTQCLYVLNNITHWRGPEAKQVRETLKAFVKERREKE